MYIIPILYLWVFYFILVTFFFMCIYSDTRYTMVQSVSIPARNWWHPQKGSIRDRINRGVMKGLFKEGWQFQRTRRHGKTSREWWQWETLTTSKYEGGGEGSNDPRAWSELQQWNRSQKKAENLSREIRGSHLLLKPRSAREINTRLLFLPPPIPVCDFQWPKPTRSQENL